MKYYRAFGLEIASEIELPELFPGDGLADTAIRFGRLKIDLPEVAHASWMDERGKAYLYWDDVGFFRISGGNEIIVEPGPGTSPGRIRLFLLGAAIGMLLLQRGQLVFHASGVALPGGVVAFLGEKWMGKSTTAAFLQDRGHTVVTDDVLAVDLTAEPFCVNSGPRQLKLWPDALSAIGGEASGFARLHPLLEKRDIPVEVSAPMKWPLKALYVLGFGDEVKLTLLQGSEAVLDLIANWYGARFDPNMRMSIGQMTLLSQISMILKKVPVFLARRPADLEHQALLVELIENHDTKALFGGDDKH